MKEYSADSTKFLLSCKRLLNVLLLAWVASLCCTTFLFVLTSASGIKLSTSDVEKELTCSKYVLHQFPYVQIKTSSNLRKEALHFRRILVSISLAPDIMEVIRRYMFSVRRTDSSSQWLLVSHSATALLQLTLALLNLFRLTMNSL